MSSLPIARMADVCKQYGPGRLPLADRKDIGAGYAMATAAVVATLIAVLTGSVLDRIFGPTSFWAVLFYGTFAFPLVVPMAFLSGVGAWRYLPASLPRFGIVAGVVATGLTYLVGTLVASGAISLYALWASPSPTGSPLADLLGGVYFYSFYIGAVAIVSTVWLTLPLGALGGSIYERARTASTQAC